MMLGDLVADDDDVELVVVVVALAATWDGLAVVAKLLRTAREQHRNALGRARRSACMEDGWERNNDDDGAQTEGGR
jgi:hypothetical protein